MSSPADRRTRRSLRLSGARMHKTLLLGALAVVLSCVATLSVASQRILSEQAAYGAAPSVDQCAPRQLDASAVLPGTDLAVSPMPGAYDASPQTQISLEGAPQSALSDISVTGSRSGGHRGGCAATPRATARASS